MAANTYDTLCYSLYEQIYQRLQRKDAERLRFATRGTAKKVLHRDNLLAVFRSLVHAGETVFSTFNVTEDDMLRRVHDRQLYDFLAVLIFAKCRVETARIFAHELVAGNAWPVRRRGKAVGTLPAGREELVDLFGVVDADMFISKQACFSTVVIRKREEVRVIAPESQRLPYLEEQALGSGAFGTVVKVKIAKGHFFDPQTKAENTEPLELARKDYLLSSEFPARGEREIMEKILTSSSVSCNNIVENYGSLEVGPMTYSLFMPLAMFDLRQSMMIHHRARPRSAAEKAKIIECAEGLAAGLNFLHTEMQTADREQMVCYHMDLKPSNILVFREVRLGEDRLVWKLSDFGMARVKIRRRDQDVEREKDFNSWFVRRQAKKPSDSSLSNTLNRRQEGTYLAPESISASKSMGTASDVWSLACVLSVVFAYLEEGSDGVERYQDARTDHPKADGYDRFFIRSMTFSPSKVHPEIHKWHSRLIDEAGKRNPDEGEAVKTMLRFLEDKVFEMDPGKRCGAKGVKDMLLNTFKKYKALADAETAGDTSQTHLQPPETNSLKRILAMSSLTRPRSPSTGRVESWSLSSKEDFNGCEISPDGSLIAYWTDVKISLYTSQSFSPREGNSVSPATWRTLQEQDCIWKTVVITRKYLIAATTGAGFNCFLYDLECGEAVDVTLDHWYRLTLPLPEIHHLAVSSDGQTLVCILRDKDEEESCWVFTASITSLIEYARRPRSSSTEGTSTSFLSDSLSVGLWSVDKLSWPASWITHLTVSGSDDVYVVVQPEITKRSRDHKVTVLYMSLKTRRGVPVIIESKGFDSSSTAGLFTTFAPLRKESATCAIVMREKRLNIQGLAREDPGARIDKDIKHCRVLRLLIDPDDRIFALGTALAHHKLLLMELMGVRSPEGDISTRIISLLPGLDHSDQFTQRIVTEAGEKYVLVAALVGPNRRAIYRVQLGSEASTS
ncbi:kinase-like domain-containing protein [Echria macrotheca]|uniref:Kinase-like domain-containing protein n=1 Tax=Echria macrotheca TaxID=438768 RepID=A0AAJ0B954_9PEZI|nr:kinase-like domain-containing protein [Echria macrotheca]